MDSIDALVIGAGVVGLAIARALALQGHSVIVLDRAKTFGTGISSRNSEVIHAGLHDTPDSLKSRLCVRGQALMYDYCAQRGIGHQRCGKLIVASTPEQLSKLEHIHQRGSENGVQGLRQLTRSAAVALEPALQCAGALWSPNSGIVDSHALMLSFIGDAQNAGATLALRSAFDRAEPQGGLWQVRIGVGAESHSGGTSAPDEHTANTRQFSTPDGTARAVDFFELRTRWIVNCAGLQAHQVAGRIASFPQQHIAPLRLAKGNYFLLRGKSPFRHLIYPTPVDGGLGVHLTLDLAGQARFGPDVQWLPGTNPDDVDFAVDASRAQAFETAVRSYWPGLPAGALQPAYSGVRPKLSTPGQAAADFCIDGPMQHGCDGVVQLLGIESPGLTASMAIAEQVGHIIASTA